MRGDGKVGEGCGRSRGGVVQDGEPDDPLSEDVCKLQKCGGPMASQFLVTALIIWSVQPSRLEFDSYLCMSEG